MLLNAVHNKICKAFIKIEWHWKTNIFFFIFSYTQKMCVVTFGVYTTHSEIIGLVPLFSITYAKDSLLKI